LKLYADLVTLKYMDINHEKESQTTR